jgi:hypothetical protein
MDNLKGLRQPEGLVYGIPKKATYMAKKTWLTRKKKTGQPMFRQTNKRQRKIVPWD